ncbi:MAG: hypothetical protein HY840_00110 [Bacteroidetes bacterium]|nr:hypothetical protein [Bacteroidota bacterium]
MKKMFSVIPKGLFLGAGLWFLAFGLFAQQCKVKPIVKTCMPPLAPYQYDAYAVKEIEYAAKTKKESIEFAVYSGEDYKLVFCKTELPQEVGIIIYDGSPNKKDRKIVFMDESGKKDQYVCNFHPTKTGSYFIEYEIPPATAPNQRGCIIVLIGIKE